MESIPRIVERVAALLDDGAAYRLEDGSGDIYFDVSAAPRFGYESRPARDQMLELFAERGGDPDRAGKRDPLDPLLWRGAREGEPAWPDPVLGPGRPGWHIECATIALDQLGDTIDVQGGGNDLVFPHHECSAAHAEAPHRAGAVRLPLRARRHDRAGRGEDEQVPGQPGLRLQAARRRAWTRWRCGWR